MFNLPGFQWWWGSIVSAVLNIYYPDIKLDLIISDDGLQHLALERQIEWIVLDQNRGLGNQKLLPEGYLREASQPFKYRHGD